MPIIIDPNAAPPPSPRRGPNAAQRPNGTPAATPPAKPKPPPKSANSAAFSLWVAACRGCLTDRRLAVDATGTFRLVGDDGRMGDVAGHDASPGQLARALWFTLRQRGEKVPEPMLRSIFEELASRDLRDRFALLRDRFLGQPATTAGVDELRRWVRAIAPESDDVDLAAVQHWMWQVKRRLAGLEITDDLMLVIYGTDQGTGKSTAVRRLVAPLEELVIDITGRTFADEREAEVMSTHIVGVLDEMARMNHAEAADIKRVISQPVVSYRRMRENGRITARRLMSFIGTANEPVSLLINDTTGARRFHQLTVPPGHRVDWDTINRLDVPLAWTAVNEHDPSPLAPFIAQLRQRQERFVARDTVTAWLDDETWKAVTWEPPGTDAIHVQPYDHQNGEPCPHTRARYLAWCATNGQRPQEASRLGHRLAALGFDRRQIRHLGERLWFYLIPDVSRRRIDADGTDPPSA